VIVVVAGRQVEPAVTSEIGRHQCLWGQVAAEVHWLAEAQQAAVLERF
jgi:hypothetical protein